MEYAAYRACRWDQPPEGTKQCTSQPGSSKRRLPCRHSRSHPRSPGRSLPSVSWKVNKKKMEIGQNPTMFIGFHWCSMVFPCFANFGWFLVSLDVKARIPLDFLTLWKVEIPERLGDDQQNRKSMGAGDEKTKLVGLAHAFPGLTNTHLNLASKP